MANINVYNEADNITYTVTVDIFTSVLDKVYGSPSDGDIDYYLRIYTNMRRSSDNAALPEFIIRNLNDVPPGYSTASSFTEVIDDYVAYYIAQSELGMSTSSSTSSIEYSSSSSSSSIEYSSSSGSSWSTWSSDSSSESSESSSESVGNVSTSSSESSSESTESSESSSESVGNVSTSSSSSSSPGP